MAKKEILQLDNDVTEVGLVPVTSGEIQNAPLNQIAEKPKRKIKRKENPNQTFAGEEFDALPDLAKLMNKSVSELRDEFFLFQIRKLMNKMAKTVVRFGVNDRQMEKLFYNAKALEMEEIVVAPAYLSACKKHVHRLGGEGFKVGAIVDFPFGESTLSSKLADIKESLKVGVDEITVMMPSMLVSKENLKLLKKNSSKIAKQKKGAIGIAFNATDLDEEGIKLAMKAVNKSKLAFLTLVFGTATVEEVVNKMATVNEFKGAQKIFALANVDSAEGIMTLFNSGVDKILTPYADAIGEELVRKFKVKSVKLK